MGCAGRAAAARPIAQRNGKARYRMKNEKKQLEVLRGAWRILRAMGAAKDGAKRCARRRAGVAFWR